MPASDYLDELVLEWAFADTDLPSALANVYVALFTALPSKAGGGTEVAGGVGYSRLATDSGDWNVFGSPKQVANVNVLDFGVATGSWGTVLGFGLYDAPTSGNLLWFASTNQVAPVSGDPVVFNVGQLIVIGN